MQEVAEESLGTVEAAPSPEREADRPCCHGSNCLHVNSKYKLFMRPNSDGAEERGAPPEATTLVILRRGLRRLPHVAGAGMDVCGCASYLVHIGCDAGWPACELLASSGAALFLLHKRAANYSLWRRPHPPAPVALAQTRTCGSIPLPPAAAILLST